MSGHPAPASAKASARSRRSSKSEGGSAGTRGNTIADNDPKPSLTIGDVTLYEGNSGTTPAIFTVTLSAVSGRPVQVAYATSNGTALAGSDYVAASGTLEIPAGAPSGTIAVGILGDGAAEPNETFLVTLSSPVNATLADG